jgi:hypothetical protein
VIIDAPQTRGYAGGDPIRHDNAPARVCAHGVRLHLSARTAVRLCLYDLTGKALSRGIDRHFTAGTHFIPLPRLAPRDLSSGFYLVYATIDRHRFTIPLAIPGNRPPLDR